jgi:hypothetical protein
MGKSNTQDDVSQALESAVEALGESMAFAVKKASDLEDATQRLDTAEAELARVKEAGAKAVSGIKEAAARLVSTLVDHSFITEQESVKIASRLDSDPALAFSLACQAVELASGTHTSGTGVVKEASSSEAADPDGWGKIAKEGA